MHRWLTFGDSWPPSLVGQLLAALVPSSDAVVFDPFVGAGTTAVCAQQHGLTSLSNDHSPLAVVSTLVKLFPPAVTAISAYGEIVERAFDAVLEAFAAGGDALDRTLQFVVAAAFVRSNWFDGKPFDRDEIRSAAVIVLDEMRADIAARPAVAAEVRRGDYAARSYRLSEPVVMVTSPPFPDSNCNPRRLKLEYAIDRHYSAPANEEYETRLQRLAALALSVGCRGVAVEVEPSWTEAARRAFEPQFETALQYGDCSAAIIGRRR